MDAHKLGKNAIKELALHLYKHAESAIKESVTNGFDQQAGKPKEAIVNIRTHVGETDDIWIEDPGTGIEDYQKFILFLEGEKTVEGKVSSYETINEDIGGNKGLGKLGFLMLAGGDDRKVIFLSHRPEIEGRYKKQCMKVTMTFDGFEAEYMDSTDPEALQQPGVRVIIPHARYDLLVDEEGLRKYLSKMFAIRLSRGQQIIFNDKPVTRPDGFNSKEEELFTLKDGTTIYGNIKYCENPKAKNIWACIKNICVEGWDFENPAQGWFNDNVIIATSSRESIEKGLRLAEINLNMQKYLDEHYPKPEGPKIGKMGKEKEKKALLIAGLQYRDHLLSGQSDPKGIEGEITGGQDKGKWHIKEKMQLLETGGDPEGPPIIPIGKIKKIRNKPIKHHGGNGSNPTAIDGGDRTVLEQEGQDKKNKKGLIEPDIPSIIAQNENKPMAWFNEDPLQFVWNTYWKETTRAHAAQGPDYLYLVAPVYAMALVNLDGDDPDKEEWQARYCRYIEFFIRKGGK